MTHLTPPEPPGGLGLPRPPGVFRRFVAAHPFSVDVALALIYLLPSVIGVIVASAVEPGPREIAHLALSFVTGLALLARRQRPAVLFGIATVVLGASVFLGRDVDVLPTLLALYALAVYRSIRSAWIAFGITSAVTIAALAAQVLLAQAQVFTPLQTAALPSSILVVSLSALAVLIGSNAGNRRRYLDALIDRARQLARERDQQAEIAAAAERSRIAGEMHDIVSHSLTVMITLADGSARQSGSDPERAAETMRLVAETGRSALADMRRLLGVLREGDGDPAREPQPAVADLGALVETFRAAGLPVRITVSGEPPEDTGQQLTIFRVVQEGLTNALRYAATATSVQVLLVFSPERVLITVDDDATVHGEPAQGSGRGLIGLRERVALYGGTLEAGPRPGGGWRTRAVFDAVRPAPAGQRVPAALAARTPAPADARTPAPAHPPIEETP